MLTGTSTLSFAANESWISTSSGSWSVGTNWNGGSAPGSTSSTTSTDTAFFNLSQGGTITINQANQNIGSLYFGPSAGSYSITNTSGNSLLLSSGGSVSNASNTSSETISAPLILEPASATSNGTYTFANISGTSSFLYIRGNVTGGSTTGTITLNVVLDSPTGATEEVFFLNNVSKGNASGLALNVTGRGGLAGFYGTTSITGTTTVSNSFLNGYLTLGGQAILSGSSALIASINNGNYVNGVVLHAGVANITEALPTGTFTIGSITRNSGGTALFNAEVTHSTGDVVTSTGNTNGILGPWAFYGMAYSSTSPTLSYAVSGGAGAPVTAYTGATLVTADTLGSMTSATTNYQIAGTGTTSTLSSDITGYTLQITGTSGGLTIDSNSHSITLNGLMNSGTDPVSITGGNLAIGSSQELNIANLSATMTISSNITGTGGALVYNGFGFNTNNSFLILTGTNTYTNGTYLNSGVLNVGSAGALGTTGTITFSGGTLQFSAANTTDYSSRFSTVAYQAYNIDTNGQSVTLSSNLTSSSGYLTKKGAGTLTLTGNNTYDYGTIVSSGTLIAANSSGSATGTGSLDVTAGATLGGNGAVHSSLNIVNGNIQVGNGGGDTTSTLTLTATGTTTFSGAKLTFSLNSGGTDSTQLAVGSTPDVLFTNNTSLTLNLQGMSAIADGTEYTLFTGTTLSGDGLLGSGFGGELTISGSNVITGGLNFTFANAPAGAYEGSYLILTENLNHTGYNIDVIVAAPEPGTWALLLCGLGALLGWRYRKGQPS